MTKFPQSQPDHNENPRDNHVAGMSSRRRMQTVFAGKIPDLVPFFPTLFKHYLGNADNKSGSADLPPCDAPCGFKGNNFQPKDAEAYNVRYERWQQQYSRRCV